MNFLYTNIVQAQYRILKNTVFNAFLYMESEVPLIFQVYLHSTMLKELILF